MRQTWQSQVWLGFQSGKQSGGPLQRLGVYPNQMWALHSFTLQIGGKVTLVVTYIRSSDVLSITITVNVMEGLEMNIVDVLGLCSLS